MKIIESPQYGPMFRFTDANVYWALHILSSGKRMGRKRLADAIGVGEGSMRRTLAPLRDWETIQIKQSGITITRSGLGFLSEIPLKVIDVDLGDSIVGDYSQSVLVFNVADKIQNGMQQRDAGIRVGATGCTTLVIRDGNLIIPPDWNMDVERPEIAKNVRATGITDKDAIIVGSGNDQRTAMMAALTAAFELF